MIKKKNYEKYYISSIACNFCMSESNYLWWVCGDFGFDVEGLGRFSY